MKLETTLTTSSSSLTQLLQSCAASSHRRLQTIHGQCIVSGRSSDLYLNNLLLNGYSKSGRLGSARDLFDRMPQRNLISWSSVISMLTQHSLAGEALSLFSSFRRETHHPNEFILASVLRACIQSRSFDRAAAQIHGLVVKSGYGSNVFVGTALINSYSKTGCMEGAMSIFDDLPVRNSVTWTAIIAGYSQIGRNDLSLHLFNRMRGEGVVPDRFVLSSAISACSALGFLEAGEQIHGFVYRSGTEMDISVSNVLVDLYCKCARARVARVVFDRMHVKNLVSWTTMISGYMQNSLDSDAMALFYEMGGNGWLPDGFACTSVLSSCGALMAVRQGKQVHGYAIKANFERDEYVSNGLIDMYAKCDSLDDARASFDSMVERNVISYNAMIEGYSQHEELEEAINLFNRMRSGSLRPTLLTLVSLLGVTSSLSEVNVSKQVHSLIVKFGAAFDLYAGSALVDVYSKCSCIVEARSVFDEMNDRDLVVWNAMIFGYAQNGEGEEALKLFHQLGLAGMKPSEFTLVALVTVSSNLASLFHGLQIHGQIVNLGMDSDPHVTNSLIDMYAKCGCIDKAWLLFGSMDGRDVVCWNSMISRFAQHGLAEEAIRVFEMMRNEDVKPNYVTFVGVLSACSHVGLADEGLNHFHSIKREFGIEPGMEHYSLVVSLLGRAGRLQDAKEFIERMPIEPAAFVWRSLLSACRVFGDVELGRYAAELAISVDPNESGSSYVLLSNMFASKGMWADVEKVRTGMDRIGAGKEPGYSWIEVMKEVHVFLARGREHLLADSVYSTLDELTQMIKGIEFVQDSLDDVQLE